MVRVAMVCSAPGPSPTSKWGLSEFGWLLPPAAAVHGPLARGLTRVLVSAGGGWTRMEHPGNGYRRLNGQFATPDGGLS